MRTKLRGEAGKSFGRSGEALRRARGGGFELRGGEDMQGALVALGEMLLNAFGLDGWKFAVMVLHDTDKVTLRE